MRVVLLIPLVCLSGCVSGSKLVRELAKDHATVSLHIRSPWGSVDFVRSNPPVCAVCGDKTTGR